MSSSAETAVMGGSADFSSGQIIGRRIGDYRILEWIAGGGMGTVYLAEQISMKRTVALKILHKSLSDDAIYLERFTREVRTLANLQHPNLVQAIEAGVSNGTAYFSMEYVPGLDLKRQIDQERFFMEVEVLQIGRSVAMAMAYAWNKSYLIHRDLKPANLILSENQSVKLLDLGISRQAKDIRSELTAHGLMVGSPTYISPEQAKGEADLDFRADIYSLGVSIYHLLAGVPPYDSVNSVAVVSMHLAAPIPDICQVRSDVSRGTADMIIKMMAKNRKDRQSSWEDLIAEIEQQIQCLQEVQSAADAFAHEKTQSNLPLLGRPVGAKWLQERVFSMQGHRIAALSVLLVLVVIAFASIVMRIIRDSRESKEQEYVSKLLILESTVNPEERLRLIHLLNQAIRRNSNEEMRRQLQEAVSRLEARIQQENIVAHQKRIQQAIELLTQRSRNLEMMGRYQEALTLWRTYVREGELRSEPALQEECQKSIAYLERKLEAVEQGFGPETP